MAQTFKGNDVVLSVTPGEEGDHVAVYFNSEDFQSEVQLPGPLNHVQEHDEFVFLATPQQHFMAMRNGAVVAVGSAEMGSPAVALTKKEIDEAAAEKKKIEGKLGKLKEQIEKARQDGVVGQNRARELERARKRLEKLLKPLERRIIDLRLKEAREERRALLKALRRLARQGRHRNPKPTPTPTPTPTPSPGGGGSGGAGGSGGSSPGTIPVGIPPAPNKPLDLSNLKFTYMRTENEIWVWHPFHAMWEGHLATQDAIEEIKQVDRLVIVRTKTHLWIWDPLIFAWSGPFITTSDIQEVMTL